MEKLLLSRNRGRPGFKGRRYQQKVHLFVCVDHVRLQILHVSFHFQNAGISLKSHRRYNCQEVKTLHNQPSKSMNDSADTLSRGDTFSVSVQDSTGGRDFRDRDKSFVSNVHKILSRSVSSKQSADQDSDEWHSDSEANWTMVGNPLKDITQSQTLSEDEPKNIATSNHALCFVAGRAVSQATDKAVTGVDDLEVGDNIPLLTYGFEPPRPIEVFGTCSWNSLCLALSSSALQDTTGMCVTPYKIVSVPHMYF